MVKITFDSIYQRLARVTSGGRYMPEIDGLRFVAILPVVLTHIGTQVQKRAKVPFDVQGDWLGWISDMMNYGGLGVNVFFAISGFILVLPYASNYLLGTKPVRLDRYFARRLNRLEPPYILALILFFLIRVFIEGQSATGLLPHLGASILYIHNLVYGEGSKILGIAWSLEIEVQFYILAPILARVFLIRRPHIRRLVIVAGILCMLLLQSQFTSVRLTLSLLGQLQYFLIGFMAVDIYLSRSKLPNEHSAWLDGIFLISTISLFLVPNPSHSFEVLFILWTFILFMAAFYGRAPHKFLTQRLVTVIGGMCYTIYLLHHIFCSAGSIALDSIRITNFFSLNFAFKTMFIFPVVILASAVYFMLIEKPCMQNDYVIRRKD
jgi:peptidoglycan/LPS O-acetylase OafA/YrhL